MCMQAIQEARIHGLKFEWEKLYGDSASPAPAAAVQSCSHQGDEVSMDQQGQSSADSSPADLIILDSESETHDGLIDLCDDSEA